MRSRPPPSLRVDDPGAARPAGGDGPAGAAIDARWWYWIAAVPLVGVGWLLTATWVAIAVSAEFGGGLVGGEPIPVAVSMATLIVGGPYAVVALMAPVATRFDVAAIRAADVGWRPDRWRWVALAAAGSLTVVGAVPVALVYLHRRHRRIGVPGLEGGFNDRGRGRP